jgi:hypothetical protein
MEPREAFFLGYLTSYVGIPFRGMDILNAANKHSSDALAARVAAQIDAFRAKNAETIDSVMRVEALLGTHGLPLPGRPQTLDEYKKWSGDASKTAGAATTPETVVAAALSAGAFYGDLLAALQIGVIVDQLLEIEPKNSVLQAEAVEQRKLAARAVERIELVLRHPALPAKAKPPLEAAVASYHKTPDALAQLKPELNKHVNELVSSF